MSVARAPAPRIPSLDGLRAISITLVLLAHVNGTARSPLPRVINDTFALGELGVRVFFVISGFLITSILLHELKKTQRISLPKFYFRRTLRLFPAFYAYVAVVVVLHNVAGLRLLPGDAAHALTYTMNYHRDRAWTLGHCWSLAVEEQFYFVWPAILWVLGARKGLWLAAAYVVFAPAIRIGEWYLLPAHLRAGIGETFPTIADSIAVGCVLAGMRKWLETSRPYVRLQRSRAFVIVPCVVVVANVMARYPSVDFSLGQTASNVCIAMCVDWAIRNEHGVVGRVLNARPLVAIGVGSYSIYLWQQLFIDRTSSSAWCAFPQNVAAAAACATASYFLIEKPCLRLREYIEPKAFPALAVPPPAIQKADLLPSGGGGRAAVARADEKQPGL